MKTIKIAVLAVAALVPAACSDLQVPDLQRPSIDQLTGSPTPSAIAAAVAGVLDGARRNTGTIVSSLGAYGREGWNLDPSNPQNINNVIVTLDPDAGSGYWTQAYRNIALANSAITALDAVGSAMTDQQKDGVRGFLKTMKAYELMWLAVIYDDSGVAAEAAASPNAELPALGTKAQAFQRAAALLDEGRTHLAAAGGSFAFTVPGGFADFASPAEFAKVNRALRARIAILTGDYPGALTALQTSFLDTSAPLTRGVYHDYSGNSGDFENPVFDPTTRQRFANRSIKAGAKLRADGSRDLRAQAKVADITPITRSDITVSEKITVYNAANARIPIIRNEELILLRAEARMRTGDRAGALSDINFIRVNSGGLTPLAADPGDAALLDELLYNRLYSLYWEQGVRWVDARRFNRFNQLPRDRADAKFFTRLSLPRNECTQRATPAEPAGCASPPGI